MPSERQIAIFAPCVAVVLATGLYIAVHPDPAPATDRAQLGATAHPAGFGSSIRAAGPTTVDQVTAAETLCQVEPDAVRALTRATAGASSIDNIRDGLPELDARISRLTDAAIGRPAVKLVLVHVTDIHKAWTKAVTAHDAGKPLTAAKALKVAGHQLKPLDAALAKAYPGARTDCAG